MHRTNLKGVNFSSSAPETRKLCVIGSLGRTEVDCRVKNRVVDYLTDVE